MPPIIPQASTYTRDWLANQRTRTIQNDTLAHDRFDQLMSQSYRSRGLHEKILILPRELRDQIYDYAWQGTHIYYQDAVCASGAVNARYVDNNGVCEKLQTLPSWVTINPQLQEEALHYFHRVAEFTFGGGNESNLMLLLLNPSLR
jgi:hypothetical protein